MIHPAHPVTRSRLASFAIALVLLLASLPAAADDPAPVDIDPFIASLLDSVDSDRMMNRIQDLQNFFTRHTWSCTTCVDTGIGAARKYVKAEFDSIAVATAGGLVADYFEWYQFLIPTPQRQSFQPMGTLPGTMPESADRVIGTGAHLDSRTTFLSDATGFAPGANDDGSGISAVLEAALIMAPHDWETSVEFHAFTGEEQGLLGSERYAEWADTNGVEITAVLSLDTIGSVESLEGVIDSTRVRAFADTTALSRNMERYTKRIGEAYVPGQEVVIKTKIDRDGRGGDHISFSNHGYTAHRFVELRENFGRQHNGNDLIDFVSPGFLTRNTKMALATLATLALAPATPGGLAAEETPEGHLRLTWPSTNTEPDFAGYRVAYRGVDPAEAVVDTGAVGAVPYTMIDVGLVNEHILTGPAPGESVYVGLAAIDDGGHESIPSREIPFVMPTATTVESVPGGGTFIGLGEPNPNPTRTAVHLAVSVGARSSEGRLRVFDVHGRHVRTLADGVLPAGTRTWNWDLADDEGRAVSAGVYFFRLELADRVTARKLVVTR